MTLNSNSGILILMSVNQSQNLGKHKTPHGKATVICILHGNVNLIALGKHIDYII